MPTYSIGQLARRAGVAIDTVRYYERNQLLDPAGRLESGYRRYGDSELGDCASSGAPRRWAFRSRTFARCCR